MIPFFIGPRDKQLFATLSSPRRNSNGQAVLLCYPFGQEYMRAHKSFRQLASLLNRAGFHVMRFDYAGTGDSFGDGKNTRYTDLLNSAQTALDHLKSASNFTKIHLVGLRLGALISAQLASQNSFIDKLILWDPITNGKRFIDDCKQQLPAEVIDVNATWNIHGFPLAMKFREDISDIQIQNMCFAPSLSIYQTISYECDDTAVTLEKFHTQLHQILIGPPCDWNYVDKQGSILMPTKLVQQITTFLSAV
ncbi:MAG: alpha/beta superfamily hydrolase [Paraglaciecola sp.]|jgi:alpha/beta superfamily hydrolase